MKSSREHKKVWAEVKHRRFTALGCCAAATMVIVLLTACSATSVDPVATGSRGGNSTLPQQSEATVTRPPSDRAIEPSATRSPVAEKPKVARVPAELVGGWNHGSQTIGSRYDIAADGTYQLIVSAEGGGAQFQLVETGTLITEDDRVGFSPQEARFSRSPARSAADQNQPRQTSPRAYRWVVTRVSGGAVLTLAGDDGRSTEYTSD